MAGKKTELEYNKYSKMGEDEFSKELAENKELKENIGKKIKGLNDSILLAKTDMEKEKLKKELDSAKIEENKINKKSDRMKGFSKNKDAIKKIRDFKQKFVDNNKNLLAEKAQNTKIIETAEKGLPAINARIGEIEKLTNEEYLEYIQKNPDELKILNDKKYEYEKNLKELPDRNKAIDEKIEKNNKAINKCDLAWTQLFANKTWDDIQCKATQGRYIGNINTPKKEEEIIKSTRKLIEEQYKKDLQEELNKHNSGVKKDENKNVSDIENDKDSTKIIENEEEKSLELTDKKLPFWKRAIEAFKNWRENRKAGKAEVKPEVESEVETENKEEIDDNKRDKFLSQLQKMVEHQPTKEGQTQKPKQQEKQKDDDREQ